MLNPHHPLHASIVRILDARTSAIVGAGFLAAPELICTCAHVVADALHIPRESEQPPEGEVRLDFPFLGGAEVHACIEVWVHVEPNDGGGDIAVLRLTTDTPSDARPVRLLPVSNLSGRAFEAYGFPRMTDVGQYAYGILRNRLANGYVQLEGSTTQGYRVQQGYSGTPVWDSQGRGVVGMVVAEDRGGPEAKVAFLIPTDLILCACPNIKPIMLHQLFAPLTDGLLPGSPRSGVEQFLREYLGTPEVPAPFGGRQAQLAELDRWLASPEQPYALLVAESGRGKSALLTRWVARVADESRAEVAFVPISIRFSTSLKSTTVSLLGARLRHILKDTTAYPHDTEGWLAEIDQSLREDRPPDTPLLIVLDGADEAAAWTMGQDLRFPPEPGRRIKVLVSARSLASCDAAGWMQRLGWQEVAVPLDLPLLDRDGVAEVLRSMSDPLAGLATQMDVVGELYRLSEGDPLLVRLYVEALRQTGNRAAFLKPEDLKGLKPGLEAYFDQWWKDQEWQWEKQGRDPLDEIDATQDFLYLCATALGQLSRDEVAAIAGGRLASGLRLQTIASEVGRFIIGDGRKQGYTFSHPRLGYYFREEQMTKLDRMEWKQRFLDFGQRTLEALSNGRLDPRQTPPYAVRYYGAHLEQDDADPEQFNNLICQSWQQAWEELEGAYDGFLSDMTRAWKRAEAVGVCSQNTQERGQAIGRQCRYALIAASIKSLVGNIPPPLMAALVDKEVWTPIEGLAYVQQIPDAGQLAEALSELAPHLSEPLLQEALKAALVIINKDKQQRAQAEMVSQFLKLGYQGDNPGEAARAIIAKYRWAWTLEELVPYLPKHLLQEALEAAQTIIFEDDHRERVLVRIVLRLGELGYGDEALKIVRAITDEDSRVQALVGLIPHLSKLLQGKMVQEVLDAARVTTNENLRMQALEGAKSRAKALAGLAPYLPEPLLGKALAAARTIEDEWSRAKALAELVPYLDRLLAPMLYHLWCETLYILASRTRHHLLSDIKTLSSVLALLGGKEALVATAQAIIEVGKWFP